MIDEKIEKTLTDQVGNWWEEYLETENNRYLEKLMAWTNTPEIKSDLNSIYNIMDNHNIKLSIHDIFPQLRFERNIHKPHFVDLMNSFNIKSSLSQIIQETLGYEDKILFYQLSLKAYLRRYILFGRLDYWMAIFFLVYRNDFNILENHYSEERLKNIHFQMFDNKVTYGCLTIKNPDNKEYPAQFYSKINLIERGEFTDVHIASFGDQYSKNNYKSPFCLSLYSDKISLDNIQLSEFLIDSKLISDYLDTFNAPENFIIEKKGLPRIGEGWISEMKLYYFLKDAFPNQIIIHHARPIWLGRQHFDIYFPEKKIAVEYQGDQHFRPIDFFGGEEAFKKNILRDEKKKKLCEENDCHLIYVTPESNFEDVVRMIELLI